MSDELTPTTHFRPPWYEDEPAHRKLLVMQIRSLELQHFHLLAQAEAIGDWLHSLREELVRRGGTR